MLTIENIDKISTCIGYKMWTVVRDTHYSFYIDYDGRTALEITLSRIKPKWLDGKPHPHNDCYLLQSNDIRWKHYWIKSEDIKNIWDMARLIETFINEFK